MSQLQKLWAFRSNPKYKLSLVRCSLTYGIVPFDWPSSFSGLEKPCVCRYLNSMQCTTFVGINNRVLGHTMHATRVSLITEREGDTLPLTTITMRWGAGWKFTWRGKRWDRATCICGEDFNISFRWISSSYYETCAVKKISFSPIVNDCKVHSLYITLHRISFKKLSDSSPCSIDNKRKKVGFEGFWQSRCKMSRCLRQDCWSLQIVVALILTCAVSWSAAGSFTFLKEQEEEEDHGGRQQRCRSHCLCEAWLVLS